MTHPVIESAIEFIYRNSPESETINIGFFGGEPLLEFDLIKEITGQITNHPLYKKEQVILTVVTNGTILSNDIINFLVEEQINLNLSCDGPPEIQDAYRPFRNGKKSSAIIERNIRKILEHFKGVPVNAVYQPQTVHLLPKVIEYFSSIGLRNIYLNPDFSACWTEESCNKLTDVYNRIGELYIKYFKQGDPHFISLIDSKIAVILRDGYLPLEKCRMGKGEFAFSPKGNIYLCERLIGSDDGEKHYIGNVLQDPIRGTSCTSHKTSCVNPECQDCGFSKYCMNWCGCSNFFSSGQYNRVSPFICSSERASIITAFNTFKDLEEKHGPLFFEHLSGLSHSGLKVL
jgi:uncharacterized protein